MVRHLLTHSFDKKPISKCLVKISSDSHSKIKQSLSFAITNTGHSAMHLQLNNLLNELPQTILNKRSHHTSFSLKKLIPG